MPAKSLESECGGIRGQDMNQDHARTAIPSGYYNCFARPCLMKVKVVGGVAIEILLDFEIECIHPANRRCCARACGAV